MRRVASALCIVILAGCSHMPAASSLPAMSQQRESSGSNFQTLHLFNKQRDGIVPVGTLLPVNGVLYGTTNFGGDPSNRCYPAWGCGAVYKFSTPSSESVLYRFHGTKDGTRPYAGLVAYQGVMYGTTQAGGQHNKGTVYSITPSGSEHVVYAFSGKDGNDPRANLTVVGGVLYGTTYYGGQTETGTVFRVTSSGTEKVLHSFTGGKDGSLPLCALISVNNVIYGTTTSGGKSNAGTVFAINPDGTNYRVLYSFHGGTDAAFPYAGLVALHGTLYGTTQGGGTYKKGTVFSISTSGSEQVLHSFGEGTDGIEPYAGLIVFNGQLYGTTAYGGTTTKDSGINPAEKKPTSEGTVFTITPSGTEQVIHNFTGGLGGRAPYANLALMNGTLYGTTIWGGNKKAKKGGTGTLFQVAP